MKNNIIFILLLIPFFGFAQSSKISKELLSKFEQESKTSFIVEFHAQVDGNATKHLTTKSEKAHFMYKKLRALAEDTQKNSIAILETAKIPYFSYWIVNMIAAKSNLQIIEALAVLPEVKRIQIDPILVKERPVEENYLTNGEVQSRTTEWGLDMMNVPAVWDIGYKGEGVTIGGQDTGYSWEHPAIKDKYRGWDGTTADHNYNWHDAIHDFDPNHADTLNPCGLNSIIPCDDHSHGTHTMGTMVGDDGEGNQIGVAPDAVWIGCRNMERGWGMLSTYVECFEFFMAPTDLNNANPDPTKAPHVIANSWSCPPSEGCDSTNFVVMETALNNLRNAGTVIVVSAGNSGSECETVSTPAAIFESSFTIGATDSYDDIAGFSSRGAVTVDGSNRMKPNVSAPGVDVRSSVLDGGYAHYSGTSMAGPHVAGVVALMISANPILAGDVDLIENILEETAVPKIALQDCNGISGTSIPNNTFGYGRVDAFAAVQQALTITANLSIPLENKISIYPNPFSDILTIELKGINDKVTISINAVNGALMHQQAQFVNHFGKIQIPLSELPSGIYYSTIETSEGIISKKLTKF